MNAYDRQLSLLRRRLILALKHQKAYMDSIYIEYTGEEYEINVRPSDPFKAGSLDLEAATNLKISGTPISMPVDFEENLGAEFNSNVGNPIVLDLNPYIYASTPIGIATENVHLVNPCDIVSEDVRAIVDMSSTLTELPLLNVHGEMSAEYDMSVSASFINLPRLHADIDAVADIESKVSYINVQSIKTDVHINDDVSTEVMINLYVSATLAKLGPETLSFWADMPLDTDYVLSNIPTLASMDNLTLVEVEGYPVGDVEYLTINK